MTEKAIGLINGTKLGNPVSLVVFEKDPHGLKGSMHLVTGPLVSRAPVTIATDGGKQMWQDSRAQVRRSSAVKVLDEVARQG